MMKDLFSMGGIALVIFPIIYALFYVFSQGHFAY